MERNGKSYVLSVSRKEHKDDGSRYDSLGDILKVLPEDGWFEASSGTGTKDMRIYDWFLMEMPPPREEGFKRCLLVRRSKTGKNFKSVYGRKEFSGTRPAWSKLETFKNGLFLYG